MSLSNTTLSTAISDHITSTYSTGNRTFTTTQSSTPTQTNGSSGSRPVGGFSTGGKIGCALGAAVVVGLLIFWLRPRKRKNKTAIRSNVREDAFSDKATPVVDDVKTGNDGKTH